jgi:hypothetical protein
MTNDGQDAQHSSRDNRRTLNKANVVRIRLNEQDYRDCNAAKQRREDNDGSDILILEVPRQQKLVAMIGAGKEEWSAQGNEKPAHKPPLRRKLS